MPSVLTVILNWRTPAMTLRAAEAAVAAMAGLDGAITIVDNDSQDGSFEHLTDAVAARSGAPSGWSRIRVLQAGRNGGFGAGNNVGIRAGLPGGARPDLVYLQNSDAFPEPDAIRILAAHLAAHPAVGLASSALYGADGAPHHSVFRFPSILGEFEGAARFGPVSRVLRRHAVVLDAEAPLGPVDWAAGASLMIRQDVLDAVGLFDERFFLYFEETDLCRRAARAGWGVHHVPAARAMHIGSESTGAKRWRRTPGYWFDSRWHYFSKTHGRAYAAAATAAHLAGGLLSRLRRRIEGKPQLDPPGYLRDLARHALGRPLT